MTGKARFALFAAIVGIFALACLLGGCLFQREVGSGSLVSRTIDLSSLPPLGARPVYRICFRNNSSLPVSSVTAVWRAKNQSLGRSSSYSASCGVAGAGQSGLGSVSYPCDLHVKSLTAEVAGKTYVLLNGKHVPLECGVLFELQEDETIKVLPLPVEYD
jgi:hypothetical protein